MLNTTQYNNIGLKYFKKVASITFSHSTAEYSKIQLRRANFRV